MPSDGRSILSDGAFERFLSSALATILTLIFSWRILLDLEQQEARLMIGDVTADDNDEKRRENEKKAREINAGNGDNSSSTVDSRAEWFESAQDNSCQQGVVRIVQPNTADVSYTATNISTDSFYAPPGKRLLGTNVDTGIMEGFEDDDVIEGGIHHRNQFDPDIHAALLNYTPPQTGRNMDYCDSHAAAANIAHHHLHGAASGHHHHLQGGAASGQHHHHHLVTDLDLPTDEDRDLYQEMAAMEAHNRRLHRHYCAYVNEEFYCSSEEEFDMYGRRMLDTISEEDDDEIPSSYDGNSSWMHEEDEGGASGMEYDSEWAANLATKHRLHRNSPELRQEELMDLNCHPGHDQTDGPNFVSLSQEGSSDKPPVQNAAVRALELLKACDEPRDDSLFKWKENNYNITAPADSDDLFSPDSSVNNSSSSAPEGHDPSRHHHSFKRVSTDPLDGSDSSGFECKQPRIMAAEYHHGNADAALTVQTVDCKNNPCFGPSVINLNDKKASELYISAGQPLSRDNKLLEHSHNADLVNNESHIPADSLNTNLNDIYPNKSIDTNYDYTVSRNCRNIQGVAPIVNCEDLVNKITAEQEALRGVSPQSEVNVKEVDCKQTEFDPRMDQSVNNDRNMYVSLTSRTSDYDSADDLIDSPNSEMFINCGNDISHKVVYSDKDDICSVASADNSSKTTSPAYVDSKLSTAKQSTPKGFIFVKTTDENTDYSVHSTVVYRKFNKGQQEVENLSSADVVNLSPGYASSEDGDLFAGKDSDYIIRRDSSDSDVLSDNVQSCSDNIDPSDNSSQQQSHQLKNPDVNKVLSIDNESDDEPSSGSSTTTADTCIEVQLSGLNSPLRSPLRSPKHVPNSSQSSPKSTSVFKAFSSDNSGENNSNNEKNLSGSNFRKGTRLLKSEPRNRDTFFSQQSQSFDSEECENDSDNSNTSGSSTEESFELCTPAGTRDSLPYDSGNSGQINTHSKPPRKLEVLDELSESSSASETENSNENLGINDYEGNNLNKHSLNTGINYDSSRNNLEYNNSNPGNYRDSINIKSGTPNEVSLQQKFDRHYVNENENETAAAVCENKSTLGSNTEHSAVSGADDISTDIETMEGNPGLEAIMAKYGIKPSLRSVDTTELPTHKTTRSQFEQPLSSVNKLEFSKPRGYDQPEVSNNRPGYIDASAQTVRSYRLPARLFALNPERYFVEYPVETTTFVTEEYIGGRRIVSEHKEQGIQVEFDPSGARERAEKHGESVGYITPSGNISQGYVSTAVLPEIHPKKPPKSIESDSSFEKELNCPGKLSIDFDDPDRDSPFRPVGASSPVPGKLTSEPVCGSSPVQFKPIQKSTEQSSSDEPQMTSSPAISSPTPSNSTGTDNPASPIGNDSLSPQGAKALSPSARSPSPEWRTEEWTEEHPAPSYSYDVTPHSMDRSRDSTEMELEVDRALHDVQSRIQQWHDAYETNTSPPNMQGDEKLSPAEEKWRYSPWRDVSEKNDGSFDKSEHHSNEKTSPKSPNPHTEEWTVEHKVPKHSIPDYLRQPSPAPSDAESQHSTYEEWTVEHKVPYSPSKMLDQNTSPENEKLNHESSPSPAPRFEEWTVEHKVQIPHDKSTDLSSDELDGAGVPKLKLNDSSSSPSMSTENSPRKKNYHLPSHIRGEMTSSPAISARSESPMESSFEDWSMENKIPKYLLQEDVNSSYSLDESMDYPRYNPDKAAPVAAMDDEFDDLSCPGTPPRGISPKPLRESPSKISPLAVSSTAVRVAPPIPSRPKFDAKALINPSLGENQNKPEPQHITIGPTQQVIMTAPDVPQRTMVTPTRETSKPPIPERHMISPQIEQKPEDGIAPKEAEKTMMPPIPPRRSLGEIPTIPIRNNIRDDEKPRTAQQKPIEVPQVPPRPVTTKPFGNLSKELGVTEPVVRKPSSNTEYKPSQPPLKPLSPVEKKIERFLLEEDDVKKPVSKPIVAPKPTSYKSVLQEPVSPDSKNISHLYTLPAKSTSKEQEKLKGKRSDFISSPPDVSEEEKQKALGTKDWEKRPKPILKRNRGDSDPNRTDSSIDTSYQSINYTAPKKELPKYSLTVYQNIKDEIDHRMYKDTDDIDGSPDSTKDDDVFVRSAPRSKSLPRTKAKSLSDLLETDRYKRASTLPSGSSICGIRLVRSPSKNLLRSPSMFFTDRAKSMTNLLETDIDTGESTATPLVIETDIDEIFKERDLRAKSLVDLRGQPSLSKSFFSESGRRSWEKTRSLQMLPSTTPLANEVFDFDDIDCGEGRDHNTSEHEIRISKSLTRLELPDWYKKSAGSRSSSRPRSPANLNISVYSGPDMDQSRHDSSYSSTTSSKTGGARVVIQHRVSRSVSPNRKIKEQPLPKSKFELPSERYRKKDKPKELQPIKSKLLPPSVLLQKQKEEQEQKKFEEKAKLRDEALKKAEVLNDEPVTTPYQVRRPLKSYDIEVSRQESYEIPSAEPATMTYNKPEMTELKTAPDAPQSPGKINPFYFDFKKGMNPPAENIRSSPTSPGGSRINDEQPMIVYDNQTRFNDLPSSPGSKVPERPNYQSEILETDATQYEDLPGSPGSRRRWSRDGNQQPQSGHNQLNYDDIAGSPGAKRRSRDGFQELEGSPGSKRRSNPVGTTAYTSRSPTYDQQSPSEFYNVPGSRSSYDSQPESKRSSYSYDQLEMSPGARRSFRGQKAANQPTYDMADNSRNFNTSATIKLQKAPVKERPAVPIRASSALRPNVTPRRPNYNSVETDIDSPDYGYQGVNTDVYSKQQSIHATRPGSGSYETNVDSNVVYNEPQTNMRQSSTSYETTPGGNKQYYNSGGWYGTQSYETNDGHYSYNAEPRRIGSNSEASGRYGSTSYETNVDSDAQYSYNAEPRRIGSNSETGGRYGSTSYETNVDSDAQHYSTEPRRIGSSSYETNVDGDGYYTSYDAEPGRRYAPTSYQTSGGSNMQYESYSSPPGRYGSTSYETNVDDGGQYASYDAEPGRRYGSNVTRYDAEPGRRFGSTSYETNVDDDNKYTTYQSEPGRRLGSTSYSNGSYTNQSQNYQTRTPQISVETDVDGYTSYYHPKPGAKLFNSYETNVDSTPGGYDGYGRAAVHHAPQQLMNGRRSMETMIDDEYDFDSPASSIPPSPISTSNSVYSTSHCNTDIVCSTVQNSALKKSWSDENLNSADSDPVKFNLTDVHNPDAVSNQLQNFFTIPTKAANQFPVLSYEGPTEQIHSSEDIKVKYSNKTESMVNGDGTHGDSFYLKDPSLAEVLDSLLALPSGGRKNKSTADDLMSDSDDEGKPPAVLYDNKSRRGTIVSISEVDEVPRVDKEELGSLERLELEEQNDKFEEHASSIDEDMISVKCRNTNCGKIEKLSEARRSYKTCHNCYTYYCSRECRKSHWERHKKRCLYSRVNSACKHVIRYVHDDSDTLNSISRIARTGYLSLGRGTVLVVFSDANKAEQFVKDGLKSTEQAPTYCSIKEMVDSGILGDYQTTVIETCKEYNPSVKFVLTVAVVLGSNVSAKVLPIHQQGPTIQRCAKLRLSSSKQGANQPDDVSEPSLSKHVRNKCETLILTAVPGADSDSMSRRQSRQLCFMNIQRKLRDRGVNLAKTYPFVYQQLIEYVESDKHFSPMTIYPTDSDTGKTFMCLIMPESDPDIEWIQSPDLIQELDLAEEY